MKVWGDDENKVIMVERWHGESRVVIIINMNSSDVSIMPVKDGLVWRKILDSSDSEWNGPGTLLNENINGSNEGVMRAHSLALYEIDKD